MSVDVMHINTVGSKDSTVGSLIRTIVDGCSIKGVESLVVCGKGQGDYVLQSKFGFLFNVLKARLFDNDGFQSVASTKKLCDIIEREQPKIVHIHNLHGYYIDLRLLSRTLLKYDCKVVITMHDCWLTTGHCASIPVECDQWVKGCNRCNFKCLYPRAWFKGDTAGRLLEKKEFVRSLGDRLTIVTPTRWMSNKLHNSILPFHENIVIAHGVSEIFCNKKSHECKPGTKHGLNILAVARIWTPGKNLDGILRVARKMPESWVIRIVGKIPHKIKCNAMNNVVFDNREVDEYALSNYYSCSDVTLSASAYESFGMTIAESLTADVPVVVNKHAATSELLRVPALDNVITAEQPYPVRADGICIDFGVPDENGVCGNFDVSSVIRAIGLAAKLKPVTKYEPGNMIESYYNLYKNRLGKI